MVSDIPFLDEILALIVAEASPERVILFGSYARGDNTPRSDIDLLIVKRGLKKGREITGRLHRSFLDNHIGIAVDILIIDTDRYEALKHEIGLVYKTINKEGKIVYGTG
jgi:predicted nucleotidyltransferase